MEFRNRVVGDLQMGTDQAAKVDAVLADARPRFGALRDLAPEERPKVRERIMADMRARIADLLTAEQKPKYAALLAEAGGRTSTRGRIYVLDQNGKPKAISVRLGISDGTSTEVLLAAGAPAAAELKEGTLVIIGTQSQVTTPGRQGSSPRLPF